MKKSIVFWSVLAAFVMICAACGRDVPGGVLLTPADVEKVTGLKSIATTDRNPAIGAGGDLNFILGKDQMVVMVQVVAKEQYEGYKKYFFKAAVSGLGEEAMIGATLPDKPENVLAFIQGAQCIALTTAVKMDDVKNNMLTVDQMVALGKIISSRL